MFVLERQFFKLQTAIVQIQIIGWLKSLLYICIDIFIYINNVRLTVTLSWNVKTYKEHSGNGKQQQKEEVWITRSGSAGVKHDSGKNDGHLKYLLWLTVDRTSCVYTVLLLIATAPSLWNKWRVQNQTRFTNTMYKFVFFSSFALRFRHCTSVILYHIHQSIEHLNLLILIYKYIW